MKLMIDTYSSNGHRFLHNQTTNQVLKDNNDRITRHMNDSVQNQQVYKTVPFDKRGKIQNIREKRKD
jgi:hypothetical protein